MHLLLGWGECFLVEEVERLVGVLHLLLGWGDHLLLKLRKCPPVWWGEHLVGFLML